MRIKCVTLLATIGLVLATTPASAQVFCIPVDDSGQEPDLGDLAACVAATTTPFGALPTSLPASWLGRTNTGVGFNFAFGSMDEDGDAGRRNFGIGIDLPVGRASLGFSGGLVDFTCDVPDVDVDCKRAFMLGARLATPLISNPIGGNAAQSFMLGLNTSVGFSSGDIISFTDFGGDSFEIGGRGISVGAGVPLGLVVRSGNITITPFIEPAFFWGHTKFEATTSFGTEEDSESGAGFALGGGVSFGFTNGFAFDIGFKKIMIDEANALIGLGISFQR